MERARSKPLAAPAQPPQYAEANPEAFNNVSPRVPQSGQTARTQLNPEKRSEVRYPVSADAVLVDHRSRTRLTGRAADLSLGSCYLDANQLLPVGVAVRLRLTTQAHSFECEAQVVYSLQGLGMVLVFTKTSPDQTAELDKWIAELSGENRAPMPAPVARDTTRSRQPSISQRPSRRIQSQ